MNNHSKFQLTANRMVCIETNNYTSFQPINNQIMGNNNNNDCNQFSDRFHRGEDGRLEYHWCADITIMRILKRRDSSPETRDLVEQRLALTKPGDMRQIYKKTIKKLERQVLVLRRPDEEERKEVKRIDLRLKRKEVHRITHIGGEYCKTLETKHPSNNKHSVHRPKHRRNQTEKPSQRSPPPSKSLLQHRSMAHIRPFCYTISETGRKKKLRYVMYASTES